MFVWGGHMQQYSGMQHWWSNQACKRSAMLKALSILPPFIVNVVMIRDCTLVSCSVCSTDTSWLDDISWEYHFMCFSLSPLPSPLSPFALWVTAGNAVLSLRPPFLSLLRFGEVRWGLCHTQRVLAAYSLFCSQGHSEDGENSGPREQSRV